MKKTELKKDSQFYIRFKNNPTNSEHNNEIKYIQYGNEWIRSYKNVELLGKRFISEASWETNWFNRNPEILKMILDNDQVIAEKEVNHELDEVLFLAKEILLGNIITISENKIFKDIP
jgi:hypothetical protein